MSLPGATLDASTLAQLLFCLGGDWRQHRFCTVPEDFSLALGGASFLPRHWVWGMIADALRNVLAPAATARMMGGSLSSQKQKGSAPPPWKRIGGCGGLTLALCLASSDLYKLSFKLAPGLVQTVPPTPPAPNCSSAMSSLARSARREVKQRTQPSSEASNASSPQSLAARARGVASPADDECGALDSAEVAEQAGSCASSATANDVLVSGMPTCTTNLKPHFPHAVPTSISSSANAWPPKGMLCNVRPSHAYASGHAGSSAASATASASPSPGVAVGRSYEQSANPDVQVSAVLRELRGLASLRLVRCKLSDGWLAQLCHSGGSSKWSAVRTLDLSHNSLTSGCCTALAAVVAGGLERLCCV